MGNIIGESIPLYVGEQIKKRQEIYGCGVGDNTRTTEEITYLNSRTGWVKLASGTSMKKERIDLLKKNGNTLGGNIAGQSLAQNNVLFGGLSMKEGNILKQRQGISGKDKAYGLGGEDFGFAPMPGIVDASIKSLNRGSLKKATINIKAHNKNQLDIIDVLYMRLGYTVLLEWGNDKYFDNKGEYTNMRSTLIESTWFKDSAPKDYTGWLRKIEKKREDTSGNYDAMYGVISNFSWTFESDGSYSVKIEIMSMGDVIESLKVNVPVSPNTLAANITLEEFRKTQQGKDLYNSVSILGQSTQQQFIDDYDGPDYESNANTGGYFNLSKSDLQSIWEGINERIEKVEYNITLIEASKEIKYNEEKLKDYEDELVELEKRKKDFLNYYDPTTEKGINFIVKGGQSYITSILKIVSRFGKIEDTYWYFIDGNYDLWNAKKGSGNTHNRIPEEYKTILRNYTQNRQKQIKERTTIIENQIKALKESKMAYAFFTIRELGGKFLKKGRRTNLTAIRNKDPNDNRKTVGVILSQNKKVLKELNALGFPYLIKPKNSNSYLKNDNSIIMLDTMSIGKKGAGAYYIRFGKFLEYIEDHIIPKIVAGRGPLDPSILGIDSDPDTNIMYVLPNQLSTNPQVCIIQNNISVVGGAKEFFRGLDAYQHDKNGIRYGKIMNIYLNLDYLENLLFSSGLVNSISLYKFLSNICSDINESLGGINNLEPVIDEASNKVYILEQTSIPGKGKLIVDLGINPPIEGKKPIINVFGYNPKDNNSSNFVRNVGLQTAITKEYATMITVGATAAGYVPGEEATAFSRWNIGIEDRFKKGMKESDSDARDPIADFEKDNKSIKDNYAAYANQHWSGVIGLTKPQETETETSGNDPEDKPTWVLNKQQVTSNTAAVVNFYKYLQASASLADPDSPVESSVGFLPFNLSLEMDGLSGFKIYNKLEVNTKFLPSNYDETMEFVITGVDHKLSNNEWTTNLSTIGTSIGTTDKSSIQTVNIGDFTIGPDLSRGTEYIASTAVDKDYAFIVKSTGGGKVYKFTDLNAHHSAPDYQKYYFDSSMYMSNITYISYPHEPALDSTAPFPDDAQTVWDVVIYGQYPVSRQSSEIKRQTEVWLPSPVSGKITNISSDGNHCVTISITGGGKVVMCHMDVIYGKVGDTIAKGAIIGRQDNIGNSTGTHLHIQIPKKHMEGYIEMLTAAGAALQGLQPIALDNGTYIPPKKSPSEISIATNSNNPISYNEVFHITNPVVKVLTLVGTEIYPNNRDNTFSGIVKVIYEDGTDKGFSITNGIGLGFFGMSTLPSRP